MPSRHIRPPKLPTRSRFDPPPRWVYIAVERVPHPTRAGVTLTRSFGPYLRSDTATTRSNERVVIVPRPYKGLKRKHRLRARDKELRHVVTAGLRS